MKILVINHEYPPVGGGGGVFCKDLCEVWVKDGHQVFVVTSNAIGLKKKDKINGVDINRCWAGGRKNRQKANFINLLIFTLTGFFLSWRLLVKYRFDFLNVHFAVPAGLIGYWLQVFSGCKNILTVHGADIYDPTRKMSGHRWWLTRWAISRIINKATYTVASTQEIEGKIKKYYHLRKKVSLIPLGFSPTDYFKKAEKVYYNDDVDDSPNKESLRLITIGRLVARKNLELLINAVAVLKGKVKLTIIGDGPQREELEDKVKSLELAKVVKFLGQVSEKEKARQLLKADLFVSSALHEGFGIVFLEAMQAGLGIVAADCGGQTYFLKSEENARFFKSNNKEDLIDKINYFCENREALEKYGKANIRLVPKFYIGRIAKEYLKLVETGNFVKVKT